MSTIEERIKQKLKDLEQYLDEEDEENKNSINCSSDENSEFETINIDQPYTNILDNEESKNEFAYSKFSKDNLNLHILPVSYSSKNFTNKETLIKNKNNIIYDKYAFPANKTNSKSEQILCIKPENKYCYYKKKTDLLNLNSPSASKVYKYSHTLYKDENRTNQGKSLLNFLTNYSTNSTRNLECKNKRKSYDYVKLNDDCTNSEINYEEEYLNTLKTEKEDIYSVEIENREMSSTNTATKINGIYFNNNEEEKYMTLQSVLAYELNDIVYNDLAKEQIESKEINSIDKGSFFYQKFNDNYTDALITSTDDSKNSDNNISKTRYFLNFFSVIEKILFVFFLFLLIALDPLITILLKLIDYFYEKYSKCINNYKNNVKTTYGDIERYNSQNNHLLICTEIEEPEFIDNLNFCNENFENGSGRSLTLYEKYIELVYFRDYKKEKKIIKIAFVIFLFLFNIYIWENIHDKVKRLLIFFLSNAFLLYYTFDLYKECLFSNFQNMKWNDLLKMI